MPITREQMRGVFSPKGVAVVGATERPASVGRTVVENLMSGYKYTGKPNPFEIYPVNPTRDEVLGLKCYKSVSEIPGDKCEQAIVITPAARCRGALEDIVKNKSVKCVVVIAAGFKEVGPEGLKLEQELVDIAEKHNVALVGPNCLGVMIPPHQFNGTFAASCAHSGSVAFISQSGAMCTAVLDWASEKNIGFSAFVSIGSMSHVEWSHLIDYLGDDENTRVISIYMESVGNAREFLKAASKVSRKKPIIVIKAGKTEAAAAAAISHTGSLAGSHDCFVAAMERAGVLIVDTVEEIQNLTMLLAMQPRPTGKDFIIVTNAGGPGVLTTDAASLSGLNVWPLPSTLKDSLNDLLPPAWSHANPIDVLGDAKEQLYANVVETVMKQAGPGKSLLVVLSPQSVTAPTETAELVSDVVKRLQGQTDFNGPVLCSWMGGSAVRDGHKVFMKNGIPCFDNPDTAARMVSIAWKQVEAEKHMTSIPAAKNAEATTKARALIATARKADRSVLTESESKSLLKLYGIDVAESIVCDSVEAAVKAANSVRYPCVVKLNSEIITHKSDVGGVMLNIRDDESIRNAWSQIKSNVENIDPKAFQGVSVQPMLEVTAGVELLVGSIMDIQFGPMVVFGSGGVLVEIYKDASMAIPPLAKEDAQKLIESTKISKALIKASHGDRFKGTKMEDLKSVICDFSVAMCELYDELSECEINPLLALPDRVIALDARVVLRDRKSDIPVAPPALV